MGHHVDRAGDLRLLDPSSELRIAEHLFERSALDALLGIDPSKINDDRLYRALDKLLPHKNALQKHLKNFYKLFVSVKEILVAVVIQLQTGV